MLLGVVKLFESMEIVRQIVEDRSGEGMIAQPFSVDW